MSQSNMPESTERSIDPSDPRWQKMPRRFVLYRHEDMSGIAGTGVVATGVLWHDGSASIQWLSKYASVVYWPPDALEAISEVHGHVGRTQLIWIDPERALEGGSYREPTTDHS